jgi:hypothetical protein
MTKVSTRRQQRRRPSLIFLLREYPPARIEPEEREGLLFCFVLLLLCVYIYSRIWLAHHHSLSLSLSSPLCPYVTACQKYTGKESRRRRRPGRLGQKITQPPLFSVVFLSLCAVSRKTHRGSVYSIRHVERGHSISLTGVGSAKGYERWIH